MNYDNVKRLLASFHILTEREIDDFMEQTTYKLLSKSEYFIQEGQICKQVAIVLSGTLRSYYTSDKDEEMTYCITFPNHFMTAYSSYLTGQPTRENVQAITQTALLIITKEKIEQLTERNPNCILFLKVIAEQQYLELEKRLFQLQSSDATNRYADLMKNHPKYIQKIPLQHLASFLGISQRHLSRIRKELTL